MLKVEFLRFDMSEYMEKHAVSRLIGAPPGYVGYEEGGLLIDAIRKSPHAVLLLDEIEKAHPDLFAILLQVMDHATLTDTHGRHADFRHVILIMTTNAGARDLSGRKMGFFEIAQDTKATGVLERVFAPEFRNRLDAIVHFTALGTREIELRRRQAHRRAAPAGGRPQDHHRADARGAHLAGDEGLRSRLRRPADGAAGREDDQEAALGAAAVRRRQRRRPRSWWTCTDDAIAGKTGMNPPRDRSRSSRPSRSVPRSVPSGVRPGPAGDAAVRVALRAVPRRQRRRAARAGSQRCSAQMTPERILAALTTGSMVPNATGISDGQKRASPNCSPGGRSAAPRRARPRR